MNTKLPNVRLFGFAFSLLVTVFSCDTKTSEPTPAAENDRVAFVIESNKKMLTEQESQQVQKTMRSFTFEEMEQFNEIRYKDAADAGQVDLEEVEYWKEWSKEVNRLAYKQTGKSYFAIEEDEMKAVVNKLPASFRRATPPANSQKTARTQQVCTQWVSTIGMSVGTGPRQYANPGTYVGRFTLPGQTDCDYVYEFTAGRIFTPVQLYSTQAYNVVFCNPFTACVGTISTVGAKIIDAEPGRNCGSYTIQVILGADRVNAAFVNPFDAVSFLRMGFNRAPKQNECWTGTWGQEKWHRGGIYTPQWDGWSGGRQPVGLGYSYCACNNGGELY